MAGMESIQVNGKTYTDFEPHTIWEAYSPTEFKPASNEFEKGELSRPDFCGWSAFVRTLEGY